MTTTKLRSLLEPIESLRSRMYNADFLLTWERSQDELNAVLLVADAIREMHAANISTRVFETGLAVSIFRDQSTRTRFAFASAADLLGLSVQEMDEKKSQIAHGETVRETANMISFLAETIGIRDDIFLGEGHKYMKEVANAVDEGFRENVLPQRPAVINLQCDLDHPTQSMADLMHLIKTFGSLDALRGKKIAMTWAYSPSYGKPLSVPQGVITLMTRFGMNVVLAHPEGYDLVPETLDISARHAKESGGSFTRVHSMEEAFRDADIVYPKSWAPFNVMKERTRILMSGQNDKLAALEKDCLANNARFKSWECTEKLMSITGDGPPGKTGSAAGVGSSAADISTSGSRGIGGRGRALYMHCLPADISGVSCEAGEVAASVFDRYRLATYHEASFKPFIIAAMILLTRFEQPAKVLKKLVDRGEPRRQ